MMPQPLFQVPDHSKIFIDANILVYATTEQSAECKALLERCSREEIAGICSYSVIIEATHRLMISEARQKGLLPRAGGGPAKFLRENPDIVKSLRDYWTDSQRIFSLNLLFLEVEEPILRQAQMERQNAGLLTNDSVIVSCMRNYGISLLATNDVDFSRVGGIQVSLSRQISSCQLPYA